MKISIMPNLDNFGVYKSTIFNVFNRHVPIKKKYIRANEAPFMSKELHKAIMKWSRLRNTFLKQWTDTNKKNYSTQKNLCKKLLKNTERSYFENLDTKKTTDNRRLSYHYLPKIHQKVKKLSSLLMVKLYPVTSCSVRHLMNFFSNFFTYFEHTKT